MMGWLLAFQLAAALSPAVNKYLRVDRAKVILTHVEIIDGTGAPPIVDRNLVVENGKIAAILPGRDAPAADGTAILDLKGYSVMPGLVGMHEHLFMLAFPNLAADGSYERPALFQQMSFSSPRLALANGVTTIRTAGSIEPATELRLRDAIDKGLQPGPHIEVTGPYLEGATDGGLLQMHQLTGPEDARETVAYWASRGVTSFKAYQHITREELRVAVDEAHKRGAKVTGHLCSISYLEAVDLGIDNLEHGFFTNTQLDPGKKPDVCSDSRGDYTLEHMTAGESQRLIALLVRHHVALTSTLPSSAASLAGQTLRPAVFDAMSPALREEYLIGQNRPPSDPSRLHKEMELERAFVAAGGLLLAGADPVGYGGLLPGFADQRELELLVAAGFAPVDAIRIATLNGAIFLGLQDSIGSIAVGKNADLVVVKGDPAKNISDIESVEIVFKDGNGYDVKKLLDSVKGRYGEY